MKKLILSIVIFTSVVIALPVLATYGVQTKTSNCTANKIIQDSACTPGAVLTTNIKTICTVGYTKTVRDVSDATKKKVFAEYGIPYSQHSNYEVDHLISLEIGGGNDISNLWPENSKITDGSLTKDKFENYLHAQVCAGKMTIQEAQKEISANWLTYYQADTGIKPTTKTQPTSNATSSPIKVIPVPTSTSTVSVPTGATGKCNDGTYTFTTTQKGACSHHGGVANWY
jgi:hypothetical protein